MLCQLTAKMTWNEITNSCRLKSHGQNAIKLESVD